MKKLISIVLLILLVNSCQRPETERVILLGIDALSTDGLQSAATPNLNRLIKDGSLSLKARGVMPTVSAPNWGSMLTGAGPEQHGMTKNGWTVDNYSIESTAKDDEGYFPSIFSVIKTQRPEYKTAIFYDWKELLDLYNEKYIDRVEFLPDYAEVYDNAVEYIIDENPDFTFIYAGHVDEVGHKEGHGSEQYYKSIEDIDSKIGKLLSALDSAGIYNTSTIMVISDHGGVGYGHGGESMAEIQVPWIIKGPGLAEDILLENPLNTFDTAPTIAYLFGIEAHSHWIGKPVFEAVNLDKNAASVHDKRYVAKPKSSVKSGIHSESKELKFSVDSDNAEIRFTTDGTTPVESSQLYAEPILLDKSGIVKAVAFLNGAESDMETVDFKKVLKIENVELITDPSPKYPAEFSGRSLSDGVLGNDDYMHSAWMGFEAEDLIAVVDLGSSSSLSSIGLNCLENQNSWIFLPVRVEFYASNSKNDYKLIGTVEKDEIILPRKRNRILIKKDFTDVDYRYIKIIAANIKKCPEGHAAAGEKAWLFVDEIIIE